ncbi:MAG: hypothetical protein U0J70_01230, partial [Atopobiaceae bacterium]|nr:hypothetical protein [Atopobiaceae bacterium]
YDSMSSMVLNLVVSASVRRSWWAHSFLSVPKKDSDASGALMCRTEDEPQVKGRCRPPLGT